MLRENPADRSGHKLTQAERKALRIADLRECSPERLAEIKATTQSTLEYHRRTVAIQRQKGIRVTEEQERRNCATHVLTLECIEALLDERSA